MHLSTSLRYRVLYIGGLAAFALLAICAETAFVDAANRKILLALRSGEDLQMIGPAKLHGLARDLTALGEVSLWAVLCVFALGYMLLHRAWLASAWLVVLIAGAAMLGSTLKVLFGRARPDFLDHGAATHSYAFPSLHALTAMTLCLVAAWWLTRHQENRLLRVYVWAGGAAMVLLIGLTRVYLGVHWPTDVLGGWIVGGLWATTMILAARRWVPMQPHCDPEVRKQ